MILKIQQFENRVKVYIKKIKNKKKEKLKSCRRKKISEIPSLAPHFPKKTFYDTIISQ